MPEIFRVPTSVRENLLTPSQMADLEITSRSLTMLMERGQLGARCVEIGGVSQPPTVSL